MSITDLVAERNIKHMFPEEKAVYELIGDQEDWLQGQMLRYLFTRVDYHGFVHGSGKPFIGTPQYNDFMDDKWSIIHCDVKEAINLYRKDVDDFGDSKQDGW